MDSCNCVVPQWPSDDLLMRYQYVSDFFIALAYFSIPLELIYFVKRSSIFPYRWVLVQFGAFIVLCGATHLISLWTFGPHTRTVAVVLTVAKIFTAIVSCATALMLIHIIPDLLSAKTRELFLKNKAAELDREMGRVRTQEKTGRHGRLLTHEIRSTLDRQTILKITLAELGKALDLEECTLWMPTRTGQELQLTHSLRQLDQELDPVPMHHTVVKQVFSSHRAVVIAPNSPVCLIRSRQGKYTMGDCVAVRVPLLPVNVHTEWPESHSKRAYALIALMLPCNSARRWHVHELQLVETVADQVAVALSHAAMLEESIRASSLLVEQNLALVVARRDAETAISARNDFLAVLNHEMRTPMHAIIALSSLLQGTQLTPEQRSMVDTILKSSNLLATLINDVLDISRLEDGSLELEANKFALPDLFKEVMKLVAPITSVKKLKIEISLAIDLPEYVVGDEKRLLQIILIVVGNAIKFTKEGSVSIRVLLWNDRIEYQKEPRSLREPRSQADLRSQRDFQSQRDLNLSRGEQHYYVRVEVVDTGVGLNPVEIPKLFNKFLDADASSTRNYGGTGLGLAICKRFLNLMGGEIRVESEGPGKGTTVTFTVKLGVPQKPSELDRQISPSPPSIVLRTDFSGVKILVTDDNGVNRMVTRGLLMRLGCDVTVVSSGSECLKEIAQQGQSFHVLLLDVCMPEMDGYEVCRRIQQQFARHERPLMVALTANTDKETEQKCMDLGMDGVIIKPISLEKMRMNLTELLQRGSLTPETRRKT